MKKIEETNELFCMCPNLSPTSVVEDIGQLFTDNENIKTAFGSDGIENISNFSTFYEYAAFWILFTWTVLYLGLIIYGSQLDAKYLKLLDEKKDLENHPN